MSDYISMNHAELLAERESLQKQYEEFVKKGLKLDMSRGKPAPNQLDLSNALLEITDYIDQNGTDTRNYGMLEGCGEAREYFAQQLGASVEETIVSGASSLNIMYLAIQLGMYHGFAGTPWSKDGTPLKFLCPAPGYDRHFRITEVFGFELITVPMTPSGPDMDIVEELVKDPAVKGMWCVPVYSNPDGYVYSEKTVQRMAAMQTADPTFKIMWDNAYMVHHLTTEQCSCPNILQECRKAGCEDRPIMFCSTSKITFAGAGVCAMAASRANIKAMLELMFPMTISYNKVNQLRHVRFLKQQGMQAHMQRHADILKPKFDAVVTTLNESLGSCGSIARWTQPKGGYFISLYVMDGCAKKVVELCKQAGVVLTGAGAAYPYGKDPADTHIRIAPTYPPIEELKVAAQLLCIATRLVSVEKLIEK